MGWGWGGGGWGAAGVQPYPRRKKKKEKTNTWASNAERMYGAEKMECFFRDAETNSLFCLEAARDTRSLPLPHHYGRDVEELDR